MQTLIASPADQGRYSVEGIGDQAAEFYKDNGFLVLRSGFTPGEIDELLSETVAICRGERGEFDGKWATPPDLQALKAVPDDEVISRFLCIHHPQAGSELIRKVLAHPSLVRVLTSIIGPDVKCMQSMLFIKSAGKPGQAWHQDEDYIPTRDRSLVGAWIALDRATVENGCLWILPGSQRPGILWPQYPHNDPQYDCAAMSYDFPYSDDDAIPVEVEAGDVVFFNGYLLHKSLPNRAPGGFRRALVNHYMSAQSFLPWGTEKETAKPISQYDNRSIYMVAGTDPYAWKGTRTPTKSMLRPDGMGGCGDGRSSLEDYKAKTAPTSPTP